MPITAVKMIAVILLFVGWSALGVFSGWKASSWHAQSMDLAGMRKAMDEQTKEFQNITDEANKAAARIDAQNDETAANQAKVTQALEDQSHAFSKLRLSMSSLHLGSCNFGPDTDQLLRRQYQAAFLPAGAQPAETDQAHDGHAAASAAGQSATPAGPKRR